MMKTTTISGKYKNKYRIKSTRLVYWDYGDNGMYFITICTKKRMHFFGEIINNKMHLNEIGKRANAEWIKTFELRSDMNLQMGEFVVMPNHFHAIIIIGDNKYNSLGKDVKSCGPNVPKNKFGRQSKNLASIMRGFKSSITSYARKNEMICFAWQPRFYDHIIRTEKSFYNISKYILNNPCNWSKDKFYK